ncbi:hypothetical protein T484DRAFT_1756519 [Baffinella frigidus]|nr:hypothetical protein T484DRAFT_1756519 [Cryptophyta sp. CCMP2293]
MPQMDRACPMFLKALLIASYRFRTISSDPSTAQKGVLVVFLPLMFVVGIWLASCIPSLVTRTRSRVATIIHIVFGIYLAVVYWILICITLAYAKPLSILTGVTAAIHFTWFCSPAHPDAIHHHSAVSHVMFWTTVAVLYYTNICIPNSPIVRDGYFILVIWAPETINMLIVPVFNHVATFVVTSYESSLVDHTDDDEDTKSD